MRISPGKGKQGGQAMVEAALVALAFIAVLIGVFDLAQVLFIHQSLVERARNAARYTAAHDYDPQTAVNMVLYNQPTAPEGGGTGFLGLTPAMVSATREGAGTADDRLVVVISNYPYRFFSPWIAGVFYGKPIRIVAPVEAP